MDRTIEKQGPSKARWALYAAGGLIVLLVIWQMIVRSGSSRARVDPTRVTTATVQMGDFREYYPVDGTVEPAVSVYLDIEEGGRVEQIFAEGGAPIQKGELILRFSNAQAQRTAIETETRLLETLDIQRNTEFNRAQSNLLLQESLLDLEHQIIDVQARYDRLESLQKAGNSPISREEYEKTRDQLKYLKDRRTLMKERIRQEEILSAKQLQQAQKSIVRLNENLELLGQIVKALEVRAPISGQLSTIDAQVGQNINRGQRIGQVDILDKLKVRVRIDQYYIARVQVDTPGIVKLDGRDWKVHVSKVYPEVKNNTFEADVVFSDETPETLKRGQTLTVELSFGAPTRTLKVAKGGYFQQTSGRWIYLVSEDGRTARKVDVRMGRQNPREVEVLEGLKEGDVIISSGYDTYNSVDQLNFPQSIRKQQEKK